MKKKLIFGMLLIVGLMLTSIVSAEGLSVQLKRTNPGIANVKPAEIIFDVVNTDLNHKIAGFIWCRSPDDVFISSSMGAASGSGAQYVSQMFFMNEGPSQKAISLVLESNLPGDKNAGCIIKYVPYLEKEHSETSIVTEIKTINDFGTTINNKKFEFSILEQDNETKKILIVDGFKIELTDGLKKSLDGMKISVLKLSQENVEIQAEYVKEVTSSTKTYLRQNGQYVKEALDNDYRELRLDKSIPFVEASAGSDAKCKNDKTYCTAENVEVIPWTINYIWWILGGVGIVLAVTIYMLGRGSK